jgi:oligoendopeptidase F
MEHTAAAAGITWDLSDLYAAADDPCILRDLDAALHAAQGFAQTYRGRINVPNGPSPACVAEAVATMEAILTQAGKAIAYAELLHAADVRTPTHGALVALTQEKVSAVRRELLFFELEWLALDDVAAQHVIVDPSCDRHRHFLASLRRYRSHVLSEPEEKILEETANTGSRAFARLFDEVLSSLRFEVEIEGRRQHLTESGVLALLYDSRRQVRRAAAAGLTCGLQSNELLLGFIFNVLTQDHAVSDRLRMYRDPMDSRHLANEISSDTVAALMQACEANQDVVERYYRLKRRLLGLDELTDYDRYAPVAADNESVPWPRCRDLVLSAYEAFSPRMARIAALFFDRRWIDAEVRSGKHGGAFCASTVPDVHPYVLVNYTGQLNDVTTVAHELGHGVHQYLSRPRGYFQADTPLVMAETASVFGEMLVVEHLLRDIGDPQARLGLLCRKIEDSIATVFRQVAMTRFEQKLHQARRREGELSREQICDLWLEANAALYGDAVTLTDGYRWWWAYISHFVHAPFYCYAYGFGELLVLALYALYRRQGEGFVPAYLDLLAAGGSDTPVNLLRPFGIDINDPGFWNLGLEPLRKMVDDAEEMAGP